MSRAFKTLIGLATSFLCACAIDPKLGPEAAVEETYYKSPTLPNAVQVGLSMQRRYDEMVSDQIKADRGTALGLIGLGAIGANLAMRNIAPNTTLGLGLAGAGLYASSSYINSKPQVSVYAAGSRAVQCALDVMQPKTQAYADLPRLAANILTIDRETATLDVLLAPQSKSAPPGASAVLLRAARDRGKAALTNARATEVMLKTSGAALHAVLATIKNDVTQGVITGMDLASLVQNLGKTLPETAGKIIAPPPAGAASGSGTGTATDKGSKTADLNISGLMSATKEAEDIVAIANAAPDGATLRNCSLDAAQSGPQLSITPSGGVTMVAGEAATFVMSGGVLPYQDATFSGQRPPLDKVTIKTDSGKGVVTIEVAADATPGPYFILFRDKDNHHQQLLPLIIDPRASGAGPTADGELSVNKPSATCTLKGPQVTEVQLGLVSLGFKIGTVDGNSQPVKVDGCLGPVTSAAIKAFNLSQGLTETAGQVNQDPQKRLDRVAGLLKDVAKAGTPAPSPVAPVPPTPTAPSAASSPASAASGPN